MEMQQTESGLVVPKVKPKPMRYGPLEIENSERRGKAETALSLLWDAMDLSRGGALLPEDDLRVKVHDRIYHFIGELLLGDDCPEKEVYT